MVGAAAIVLSPAPPSLPAWALLAWAAAVGVGVDFDHLLVARLNSGDWSALRRLLHNPSIVVLDQDAIFDDDLWARQRLLSHHVLGGFLVAALVPASVPLAAFTALILYAHVLADLVHDNRRLERDFRRHERYVATVDDDSSPTVERETEA